jgi:hypothetical protein
MSSTRHRSHPLVALVALASPALAGCGHPFAAATPPGFVDLSANYTRTEYRAATADGVVLGVRAVDNDPKGELSFWSRAVENRMRGMGGYALLEKRDVVSRGGQKGAQFRFGHDEGKTPHLYYLTLFVTDDRVFLLEAGGTKTEMERQAAQIDWAVKNFLPK